VTFKSKAAKLNQYESQKTKRFNQQLFTHIHESTKQHAQNHQSIP